MELSEDVTIYVLDSHRPVNLRNAFWNNEIIVFHDSDLDRDLAQEKDAIIFTEVCFHKHSSGCGVSHVLGDWRYFDRILTIPELGFFI